VSIVFACDVTAANYGRQPAGLQLAGYSTGGSGIAWTAAMWAAHPGAVRIDQDPAATVVTADVLDVENGAVPVGSPRVATWAQDAMISYAEAKRPGQRQPAVYCSASNVTANVNALIAGGVRSGVGLWVANWNLTSAQSVAEVLAASGPFPVIGVQYTDEGDLDLDVFSAVWLDTVSGKPAPQPPAPASWSFGPLTDFKLAAVGPHSLKVTFSAPSAFTGTPPTPAPGISQYQMAVCKGASLGTDIPGYPRYLAKGANPESWSEGGLTPNTQYTVAVRAYGTHSGPWSTATFTTPAS
jgi:hypothetical protein